MNKIQQPASITASNTSQTKQPYIAPQLVALGNVKTVTHSPVIPSGSA